MTIAQTMQRARPVLARIVMLMLCLTLAPMALAQPGAPYTRAPQSNAASSDSMTVRWNGDLLRRLGIRLDGRDVADETTQRYALVADGTDVRAAKDGLGLATRPRGTLLLDTGPTLRAGRHTFSLARARVVLSGRRWSVQDDAGRVWLVVDHLMPLPDVLRGTLDLRTADLRIGPALAQAIGRREHAGLAIGEVSAVLAMRFDDTPAPKDCGAPNWHGNPVPGGGIYENDVLLVTLAGQFVRCMGCDGDGGGDGTVIVAPSTTLANNRNRGTFEPTLPGDPLGTSTVRWAADVPWYTRFTGNFPPFQNDQHPYLLWNLYRLDADGRITQIGRSALKHAFGTSNDGVDCERCNGGHVLGRACLDLYSIGSNDLANAMGPRSEVIPARGIWGRCGSTFDPDCDGDGADPGIGPFDMRMRVSESQIEPAGNPGATWLIEAYYVVRDDRFLFNTMGTRPLTFTWQAGAQLWSVAHQGDLQLGSALDRWIDAAGPSESVRKALVETAEGRLQVGVRVRPAGAGTWRYEYAVMNADFSRAVTTGTEPNLRVLRNHGVDRFTVTLGAQAQVSSTAFTDGDTLAANDWPATTHADRVEWLAPDAASGLAWGSLYRFTVIADRAPFTGENILHVTEPGSPATLTATTLSIGSTALFADGFE